MKYAATGHRPEKLGGYDEHAFAKLFYFAKDTLTLIQPTTMISGMAQGWDQAIAAAAIELNIKVIAAIPCVGQEKLWPEKAQRFYHALLAKIPEQVFVSKKPFTKRCMQVRNIWMVDNCEKVLALWDETPGGTANCVMYARAIHRPVVNVYEHWRARK